MTINPGASFADNSVTIQKLHDLVDKATLTDLSATKLASGLEGVYLARDASPVEGHNAMATLTGHIEVYDGSAWNGQPDDQEGVDWVYMQNWAGYDCPGGGGVCTDLTNGWPRFDEAPAASAGYNFVGIADTTIASGATGKIWIRGNVVVTTSVTDISAGDWALVPIVSGFTINVQASATASNAVKGTGQIGVFLEDAPSSQATCTVKLWR